MKEVALIVLGTVVAIFFGCLYIAQLPHYVWADEVAWQPDMGRVVLDSHSYPAEGYEDRNAHCFKIETDGVASAISDYTPSACQMETNVQVMSLVLLMLVVEVACVGILLWLFGD